MTTNPLRVQLPPAIDPVAKLHAHVNSVNANHWVGDKLYYVASRIRADGTTEHFVDRHI
jgi:hypothetical protein